MKLQSIFTVITGILVLICASEAGPVSNVTRSSASPSPDSNQQLLGRLSQLKFNWTDIPWAFKKEADNGTDNMETNNSVCHPDLSCVTLQSLPRLLNMSRSYAKRFKDIINESELVFMLKDEQEQEKRLAQLTQLGSKFIKNYLENIKDDPDLSCLYNQRCFQSLQLIASELNENEEGSGVNSSSTLELSNGNQTLDEAFVPTQTQPRLLLFGFIRGIWRVVRAYYFISSVVNVVRGAMFIISLFA